MKDIDQSSELALAARQKKKEKNYWLNQLAGDLTASAFPRDGKRRKTMAKESRPITFRLQRRICDRVIQLSKGSDLRLHILFVAVISLLLDKYTDNRDIIIATPIDKQENQEDLINTVLAIRNRIDNHMRFKEFLLQVSRTIFEAAEHRNYPIQVLADQLNMPSSSLNKEDFPLFDTAVLLENIHDRGNLRHIRLSMIFSFVRLEDGIRGKVEYNDLRYSESRVRQIIRHLERLMEQAFFNPETRLADIDILSEEEKNRQLYDFNGGSASFPLDKPLQRLFEKQVVQTPDQIALIGQIPNPKSQIPNKDVPFGQINACGEMQLTYKELNQKSNRLAHILRNKGIKEDTIVGIMAHRSIEMVVGMIAVLKTGGAFLPISPGTPRGRKKFILEDSETAVVLTQKNLSRENKDLPERFSPENIFLLDDDTIFKGETSGLDSNLEIMNRPDQLAYIIYTSVSTGKFAGVMVEHPAVINLIYSIYNNFNCDFGPKDRCLNLSDISLDVSICELFLPLVFGAVVVLLSGESLLDTKELSKSIVEKAITFAFIPPALLGEVNSTLRDRGPGTGGKVPLDKVLVGGESIPYEVLAEFQALNPAMQILNGYGPPEACICAATYKFTPTLDKGMKIPVGKPLTNIKVMVLNQDGELYPLGSTGELYIAGAGLARGYLNHPELTAEKFKRAVISHSSFVISSSSKANDRSPKLFTNDQWPMTNDRFYKTGDLVRWLEDGNIEFTGIGSDQIEIKGYRIEPGEIEHQLMSHKLIKEAVVIDKQTGTNDKYLCAYVVFHPSGAEAENVPTSSQLVDFLSNQLPAVMIPQYFVPLDVIPLTANGKVDRKSLPDPQKALERKYVAPGSPIEKSIANTWKEILKKDRVGINDNFFEIGGNSLGILKLKNRLKEELGKDIPDIKFLEYPTIHTFYLYLQREILNVNSDSKEEEFDPYETEDDESSKLKLRRKILGNIVDV